MYLIGCSFLAIRMKMEIILMKLLSENVHDYSNKYYKRGIFSTYDDTIDENKCDYQMVFFQWLKGNRFTVYRL